MMKIVAYYNTPFEAEVARTKLHSEGIEAVVLNEHMAGVLPVAGGIGSLRPYVATRDEDRERAREVLHVEDAPPLPEVCPACGSKDFALRLSYRGRPTRAAWLLPLLLVAGNSGAVRRGYYCRSCGGWF